MKSILPPFVQQAGGPSVWCPENLDVDSLLESHGQRVGEGVLWLGHCVYTGLANDARCRDVGRVPLTTTHLRSVIGRHYLDAARKAAEEIGYVERDSSYRVGHYSQSYALRSSYNSARLIRRTLSAPSLRINVCRWRESRQRAEWERIRHNKSLVDAVVCQYLWQNLRQIRIDDNFYAVGKPAHQIAVEHLREGELWFTVDDYGRIHTNVTNLPKQLRKHLTVGGESLVTVDISESQPLFIASALAREENNRTSRQREQRGEQAAHRTPYVGHNMLDKNPLFGERIGRDCLSADLRCFLESCESRCLYQTIADRLGKTRDESKRAVMVAFFDKPWHQNTVTAAMDELFPSVTEAMRRIKTPDYRKLAHLAQRMESAFMFGRVVPQIRAQRPDLFVATIHDAVLTTADNGEFVRKVMLKEFAELGISPQVKVEAA